MSHLARSAQPLIVEARRYRGVPPQYEFRWQPVWAAIVERLEINIGRTPSTATIWFPSLRWQQSPNLQWGDIIRIRSADSNYSVLFIGILTNFLSDFSGGEGQGGGYEHCAIFCQSARFLMAATSAIFGQYALNHDGQVIFLSGRRMIFNEDGKPNFDGFEFFADPNSPASRFWTARTMVDCLFAYYNNAAWYWSDYYIPPHSDWNKTLNHIVIEGLNLIEALDRICNQIGWSFREDYFNNGYCQLAFFKCGDAGSGIIRHWLHAPAAGETIAAAVEQNRKMLCAMTLTEDIAGIVNTPIGLGAIGKFEFTAALVPAWIDFFLNPDTSESLANLYLTNSELQDIDNKDAYSVYRNYHAAGNFFNSYRDIGRRWSLNETGRWCGGVYNRPGPFNFTQVIPAEYIFQQGKKGYAPFARQLLPCLTKEPNSQNSIGIKVEFSFDFGVTWQTAPAGINTLDDEAGIYISADNLSEIVDKQERDIAGGPLNDIELNYWTSLCDDILNNRAYPNWRTRIRVTAAVQMDQRIWSRPNINSAASVSPFQQEAVFDHSDKYLLKKRTAASEFFNTVLPAENLDHSQLLTSHLQALRQANEELSVSGRFVLDRLWLGDGSGFPTFCIGDLIERITGRNYNLGTRWSGGGFPEIVQIVYLPEKQKQILMTRDLRFGEVAG